MVTWNKEKMRVWMREQRKLRRDRGLCTNCGSSDVPKGFFTCKKCLARHKRNYKERKARAVEKIK